MNGRKAARSRPARRPKPAGALISEAMTGRLNEQVNNEMYASAVYLGMSCIFDGMGLKALRARFRAQSDEERRHALKIVDYILDVAAVPVLLATPQPPAQYPSVLEALEAALENERVVTQQINELVSLAESDRDYSTRSFLHWFVDEQVEEVSSMTYLVQLARLAGDDRLELDVAVAQMKTSGAKDEDGSNQ